MKKRKVMVSLLATALLIGGAVSLASCGDKPSEQQGEDEATVVSLEVTKMPTKTEYQDGENFDPTGMEISGVLDNGKKKVIPNEELRMTTKAVAYGDKSVTVKYGRLSVEVPITVKAIELTDFTLDHSEETVEVGARIQLHATFTPENASEKGLTYSSSKDTVATVSESGEIRAVGLGDATITVKSVAKASLVKTVLIHVKATAITGLELDVDDITLKEGETKQIGVTITPANATEKGVTFTSSEPTVASVSATGLIEALKEGKTTITVETVATNAQGQKLKEEFEVTVESIATKYLVAFRNSDGTLVQGYKEGEIEVGAVPEFTAKTPRKAKDAEGVYVFRGFDKEILPYAASEEEVTYTAVYQKLDITATNVKLVESGDKLLYEVTFDAAKDVEGFRLRAMIHGGSWGTSDLVLDGEIQHNADGTFVARANLLEETNFALLSGSLDTSFIGKFTYEGAGGDIDLKVHTRCDQKRYRHDASGKVIEVNTLADDWDGVEGYDSLSEEFKNAIPAPTWDGLGIELESRTVVKNGYNIELFTNATEWNNASLKVSVYHDPDEAFVSAVTPKSADVELIDDKAYYVVSGEYAGQNVTKEVLLDQYGLDFQHNSNLDGAGWTYLSHEEAESSSAVKFSGDSALSSIDPEQKTFTLKVPVADPNIAKLDLQVFSVHSQFGGQKDNMKNLKVGNTKFTLNGFDYSIQSGSNTWNIAALRVERHPDESKVLTTKNAELVEVDGVITYRISGEFKGYEADDLVCLADLQSNPYYFTGAYNGTWTTVWGLNNGEGVKATIDAAPNGDDAGRWHFDIALSNNANIDNTKDAKDGKSVYTVHFQIGKGGDWVLSGTNRPNLVTETFSDVAKSGSAFKYSIVNSSGTWNSTSLMVESLPVEHDEDEEPNVGEHGIELSATEKVRFEAEKVDTKDWVLAGGNATAVVERADASDGKFLAAATGDTAKSKPAYFKIYVPETKEYDIAGAFAQVESKKSNVVDMALTYQLTVDNTQKIAFTGTLNAREDITVWQFMELARASLTKGNHDVKLEVVSNTGKGTANVDYFEFTPVVSE